MKQYNFINLLNEASKTMSAKEWWELEKKLKPKLTPAQKKVRDKLNKGWKIWIVNKHHASGGDYMWKEPGNDEPQYAGAIYKGFNNYLIKIGKLAGENLTTPKEFFYTPTKKQQQLVQKEINEKVSEWNEGDKVYFYTEKMGAKQSKPTRTIHMGKVTGIEKDGVWINHRIFQNFEFIAKSKKDLQEGKLKEGKKSIYVVDERSVGKHAIILMQDPETSTMRTAILKKDKVNKYNRNKQEDIDKLWALAIKYKGKLIPEGKKDYEIYHDTYTSVIDEITKWAERNGITITPDDVFDAYSDGFFKPRKGQTKRDSVRTYKNGKEQRKNLHTQIYNRGTDRNTYELNLYYN